MVLTLYFLFKIWYLTKIIIIFNVCEVWDIAAALLLLAKHCIKKPHIIDFFSWKGLTLRFDLKTIVYFKKIVKSVYKMHSNCYRHLGPADLANLTSVPALGWKQTKANNFGNSTIWNNVQMRFLYILKVYGNARCIA